MEEFVRHSWGATCLVDPVGGEVQTASRGLVNAVGVRTEADLLGTHVTDLWPGLSFLCFQSFAQDLLSGRKRLVHFSSFVDTWRPLPSPRSVLTAAAMNGGPVLTSAAVSGRDSTRDEGFEFSEGQNSVRCSEIAQGLFSEERSSEGGNPASRDAESVSCSQNGGSDIRGSRERGGSVEVRVEMQLLDRGCTAEANGPPCQVGFNGLRLRGGDASHQEREEGHCKWEVPGALLMLTAYELPGDSQLGDAEQGLPQLADVPRRNKTAATHPQNASLPSGACYRSLLDAAGIGTLSIASGPSADVGTDITTHADVIADVSDAAAVILDGEVTGRGFGEVLAPVDRQGVLKSFRKFRNGGVERWTQEARFVRGDGSLVWTRLTASRSGGQTLSGHTLVLIEDISKSKEPEHLVSDRFQAMVSNLGVAAVHVDRSGGAADPPVHCNPLLETLLGQGRDPVSSLSVLFRGLHGDEFVAPWAAYEEERKQVENSSFQTPKTLDIVQSDGSKRSLRIARSAFPEGEVWIVCDVTSSVDQYKAFFELATDPFFTFNDGKVLECNPAAVKRFGYEEKSQIQEQFLDLLSPEFQPDGERSIDKAVRYCETASSEVCSFEWVHARKDGSLFPSLVYMRPLKAAGEEVMMAILHDLAAQKSSEVAIRAAKEAAERANMSKSQFLSNASHEIRTPMNGVIGVAELLLATDLTPEQMAYAETIRSSGDFLLNLINDILDAAKIDAQSMQLEGLEFRLREEVSQSLALLEVRAREKGIAMSCRVSEGVPNTVIGDPMRLRQIIMNLVSNALKFTDEGAVEVIVRVAPEESSGDMASGSESGVTNGLEKGSAKSSAGFRSSPQSTLASVDERPVSGLGPEASLELVSEFSAPKTSEPVPQNPVEVQEKRARLGITTAEGRKAEFDRLSDLGFIGEKLPDACFAEQGMLLRRMSSQQLDTADAPYLSPDLPSVLLQVEVKDTGVGVPEEAQARVFEAFAQADSSTSRRYGGTGLGLCICQSLCARMGGRIWLTSVVGQGTSFFFTVRLGLPAETTPVNQVTSANSKQRRRQSAGYPSAFEQGDAARMLLQSDTVAGLHVLIADDNKVNQMVASKILLSLGCTFEAVDDGWKAVQACMNTRFDLVLMDCHMPIMDGYDATRAIRVQEKLQGRRHLIIALTASALEEDAQTCFEAGMDSFLSKPIRPQDIKTAIESYLPA